MTRKYDEIIDCQHRLIEALRTRDASMLETTTRQLSDALAHLREDDTVAEGDSGRLSLAMSQVVEARHGIDALARWTGRRINLVPESRCETSVTYLGKRLYPQDRVAERTTAAAAGDRHLVRTNLTGR